MNSHITRGGQVSIPAEVRRRWGTDQVVLDDQGDSLVIRPMPLDLFAAARGSLKLPAGMTSETLRRLSRKEEAEIDERKEAERGQRERS